MTVRAYDGLSWDTPAGYNLSKVVPAVMRQMCRGIVTADVLELRLSRGAIATRKLKGKGRGKVVRLQQRLSIYGG